VNEKILSPLGELKPENTFVLSTVTVPRRVEDFTMNLKAPIIINTENNKAAQIIVEDDYPVKFKVYDILQAKKERAGE
jgi:flagellar assembly factor FliW